MTLLPRAFDLACSSPAVKVLDLLLQVGPLGFKMALGSLDMQLVRQDGGC